MAQTKQAYRFDTKGYYNGTTLVMEDPITGEWLLPSDCTLTAPKFKEGSWSVYKNRKWGYAVKPVSAEDCVGIEIEHSDNSAHANEVRALFTLLVTADSGYEIKRDDNLTLSVVKKDEASDTEDEIDDKSGDISTLDAEVNALKEQMVMAMLSGDEDWIAELRTEYNELMGE